MKVEQLKKVAELLGYTIVRNCNGHWAVNKCEGSGVWIFNPEENPAQLLECIEYLLYKRFHIYKTEWGLYRMVNAVNIHSGKALTEAVMTAMSEVVKDE